MSNLGTRALAWAYETFGAIAKDPHERARRLLEEALELAQAEAVTEAEALALVARVFSRPAGNTKREVGQVYFTLSALAANSGLFAFHEGELELVRCMAIPKEEWQARHDAKVQAGLAKW